MAALATLFVLTASTPALAATQPHYASCAAVHQHWSGGIAKNGVVVNVVHHRDGSVSRVALKGTVQHSTALYEANARLDADHDGVACEKS